MTTDDLRAHRERVVRGMSRLAPEPEDVIPDTPVRIVDVG